MRQGLVCGNQRCCRHGGRRDGRWSRRCGGCTRRAPSATGLYQLILIRVLYNLGYPGLSWVIPKHRLSWDILGYLGISRLGVYPMITRGNPGQPDTGRGTGAQIASRLSVVFLVFSVNAGKTKDIPKLVGQLPSAAPSFNCKLHRFNMREKTHD